MKNFNLIVGCFCIFFAFTSTSAQDVCVLGVVVSNQTGGYVVQSDMQRIPGMQMKIFRKKMNGKMIANIEANENGEFFIPYLKAGEYTALSEAKNYIPLVFKLQVVKDAKTEDRKILITLGTDYNQICGGGDVEVIQESE